MTTQPDDPKILGPNTKRERLTCPDCGKRRMCSIIAGITLACDECQDERNKRLAAAPKTDYTSREYVNKYMRNGFDHFVNGFKSDGETLNMGSGKNAAALRLAEVVFIRDDGYTVASTSDAAPHVYLLHPDKWVGVLVKPNPTPKDPRTWLREWTQVEKADKPGSLSSKLPRRT